MNDSNVTPQKGDVWERLERALAESKISREHTERLLRLDDKLDVERRETGRFLIDKFVPILTAILGGIAYVLIEHKVHHGVPLNCFRFSGVTLAVALIIIFAWAWLEPVVHYQFKEHLLNYEFGKPSDESWLMRHYDVLDAARLFAVAFLVISSLSTATFAVVLESRYNSSTSPPSQKA